MVPEGWILTKIGDTNVVTSGGTPSRNIEAYWDGCIPWVTTGAIDFNIITKTEESITEDGLANSSAKLFPKKTLLVGLYGDGVTRGKVAMLGIEAATNQACAAILPGENVSQEYLFYYVSAQYDRLRRQSSDGNQKNLSGGLIKSYPLLLPPLQEQNKIAVILLIVDRHLALTQQLIVAKLFRNESLLRDLLKTASAKWPTMKLGELFKNRKAKGKAGLPTYSVTMNAGLVPRDSLDRKHDTTLEPEQHLLIEKGDIAYNMMRMWQGASGIATESGLVSPAYVVIRSRGQVDPLFASYWFKMPRVVKKFQDYSHGLTKDRLRLYYKDFASISLPLPPLKLQQQIAKVMQCCDDELDALERKLELLKRQKKGLMEQLLTGKTRVKLPKGNA